MQCPTCNTVLDDNHPAAALIAIQEWVASKGGWDLFEGSRNNVFTTGTYAVQVVDKKVTYETGDIDRDGLYGELPQGSNFKAYIIFQVGDNFFKKEGTGDSYGEVSWDGEFRSVVAKEKVVRVFE